MTTHTSPALSVPGFRPESLQRLADHIEKLSPGLFIRFTISSGKRLPPQVWGRNQEDAARLRELVSEARMPDLLWRTFERYRDFATAPRGPLGAPVSIDTEGCEVLDLGDAPRRVAETIRRRAEGLAKINDMLARVQGPKPRRTEAGPAVPPPTPASVAKDRHKQKGVTWQAVDLEVRNMKAKHADLLQGAGDGRPKALENAKKIFGRNEVAKRLGCSRSTVSKSKAWRAVAGELGIPLHRGKATGTRHTARPRKVGLGMASDEKATQQWTEYERSQDESDVTQDQDQQAKAHRLIAELGKKKGQADSAKALRRELDEGTRTPANTIQLINTLLKSNA